MQLQIEDKRFYVYIYLNSLKIGNFNYGEFHFDYSPFYVGKGCGRRLYIHLNEAENFKKIEEESIVERYNAHKLNTINKIKRFGKEPIILKIRENLSNYNAGEFEKYLIKLIGRADKHLGPLTNWTDGGEGAINVSEKSKQKGIASMKKTINDPEWKATKGKIGAQKRSVLLKEGHKNGTISPPSNKGKTKETNESVRIGSEKMKKIINDPIYKATKGKEAKKKQSKSLIKGCKVKGKNNPMYGTTFEWYTNGKENKRGTFKNIEQLIQLGFWKGLTTNHDESAVKNRAEAQKNSVKNKGKYAARAKGVINLDTQISFYTITEARKFYNLHNQSINDCCMNKRETCSKGFHWNYYDK
jgi:hypothetical protein